MKRVKQTDETIDKEMECRSDRINDGEFAKSALRRIETVPGLSWTNVA